MLHYEDGKYYSLHKRLLKIKSKKFRFRISELVRQSVAETRTRNTGNDLVKGTFLKSVVQSFIKCFFESFEIKLSRKVTKIKYKTLSVLLKNAFLIFGIFHETGKNQNYSKLFTKIRI